MAFDVQEAAIRAQQIITEHSESAVGFSIPRIIALVPVALHNWSRLMLAEPSTRDLFATPISVTFNGGQADIKDYTDGTKAQIDLRQLRAGNTPLYVSVAGVRTTMTWVASQSQLNNERQLDSERPAVFLDGYVLRARSTDGGLNNFGETVNFTAADIPRRVEEIPAQLQGNFVEFLAQMAARQLGGQ